MTTGTPQMLIRAPHFSNPIRIPDRPGIAKQDKESLIRQSIKVIEGMQDLGEDVYTSQLIDTYNTLFDAVQKDLLQIYALENAAILDGKSRSEVRKISKDYVDSKKSNLLT